MFRKVMRILHEMGHVADLVSEFESYYAAVQREGFLGGPTADEARADYRATHATYWRASF